jgi:diguanylate cyclase with GGDEF domain
MTSAVPAGSRVQRGSSPVQRPTVSSACWARSARSLSCSDRGFILPPGFEWLSPIAAWDIDAGIVLTAQKYAPLSCVAPKTTTGLVLDRWAGVCVVAVDTGLRHRDDFRMEGGDTAVAAELYAVAATVAGHMPELSSEIWALLTHDIPELHGDHIVEKLLDASIEEENVATLLHVFEHGLVPDQIRAPPAAVEYARRLAQRGVSAIALIRSYRIGHGRFLSRCIEQLASRITYAALNAAVTLRLVDVSFRYIDQVSEELISVYQQERDRWLLTQTAVRAGRVRELLRAPVDIDTTESALVYRLRRHHLGVIAWVDGAVQGSDGLTRLDRRCARAARALNSRGRHLFMPRDESLARIWIPLGADTRVSDERLPTAFQNGDALIRVAVGAPGYRLDRFRQTHVQAERTQDLALAAKPGARVTTFADVGAIALISADVDAARSWVWGTLADLALDDESQARLRNTRQVLLRAGTYTATAERLALHKTAFSTASARPKRRWADALTIAVPTSSLLCEPANTSARRYFGPWIPARVWRANHLITFPTERRTDV